MIPGKAGPDRIPAEIYNIVPALVQCLLDFFKSIWKRETIPDDLMNTTIVIIFRTGAKLTVKISWDITSHFCMKDFCEIWGI